MLNLFLKVSSINDKIQEEILARLNDTRKTQELQLALKNVKDNMAAMTKDVNNTCCKEVLQLRQTVNEIKEEMKRRDHMIPRTLKSIMLSLNI